MIRPAFFTMTFFSMIGLAAQNGADSSAYHPMTGRITEFEEGSYLGDGRYVSSDGSRGSYSVLADIFYDAWDLNYVRYGKLSTFSLNVEFDDLGFFVATAIENKIDGEILDGHGYCASMQCHLTIELADGVLEETITFASWEESIYRLGSMTYMDAAGEEQLLTWEEKLFKLPPR